jgi:hypothetical protein
LKKLTKAGKMPNEQQGTPRLETNLQTSLTSSSFRSRKNLFYPAVAANAIDDDALMTRLTSSMRVPRKSSRNSEGHGTSGDDHYDGASHGAGSSTSTHHVKGRERGDVFLSRLAKPMGNTEALGEQTRSARTILKSELGCDRGKRRRA